MTTNAVNEYRTSYKYTKNLTKEYQPRNLNVLDENGQLLSAEKMVMDRWKEYFQGKLSDQGQLTLSVPN
jgi:cation transport regulator ChaC